MQLSREEIFERLKYILLQTNDNSREAVEKCTEDSLLTADLGLSSVGMLYVVIAIEETFNIRFENIGMSDFQKVKDVVDYVETRIK